MILPFICFDADDALRPDAQSCGSFLDREMTLKYKQTTLNYVEIFDNRRRKKKLKKQQTFQTLNEKLKTNENSARTRLTCSEVKAASLGTEDIPFSFTSGNILKRASSMAYMLEIAPPGGHTR